MKLELNESSFSRIFFSPKMQQESLFDMKKEEDLYAILGCVDTSSVSHLEFTLYVYILTKQLLLSLNKSKLSTNDLRFYIIPIKRPIQSQSSSKR
jgi:hypothetical protein